MCITGGFREKAEEQLLGKPKEDNRWVQGMQGHAIIGSRLNDIIIPLFIVKRT